jgi:hypothetical protein
MHPHVIGHRSRITLLGRLVKYIKGKPGVWFGTHEEVARWCAQQAGLRRRGGGGTSPPSASGRGDAGALLRATAPRPRSRGSWYR